jgi:hypothetical protein
LLTTSRLGIGGGERRSHKTPRGGITAMYWIPEDKKISKAFSKVSLHNLEREFELEEIFLFESPVTH